MFLPFGAHRVKGKTKSPKKQIVLLNDGYHGVLI